jgi:hypothetical protein
MNRGFGIERIRLVLASSVRKVCRTIDRRRNISRSHYFTEVARAAKFVLESFVDGNLLQLLPVEQFHDRHLRIILIRFTHKKVFLPGRSRASLSAFSDCGPHRMPHEGNHRKSKEQREYCERAESVRVRFDAPLDEFKKAHCDACAASDPVVDTGSGVESEPIS